MEDDNTNNYAIGDLVLVSDIHYNIEDMVMVVDKITPKEGRFEYTLESRSGLRSIIVGVKSITALIWSAKR